MLDERSRQLRTVMSLLDIITSIAAYVAAVWWQAGSVADSHPDFISHAAPVPMLVFLWMFFSGFFGAYRSPRGTSLLRYMWVVFKSVSATVAVLLALLFMLQIQYVSRAAALMFAVLDLVLLWAVRAGAVYYFRTSLRRGDKYFLRILIIGTGSRAIRLAGLLREKAEWGLHIIGHLDPDSRRVGTSVGECSVLGTVQDISTILKNHVVDEVILAVPRAMIPDVDAIARACEEEGVKLRLMADVFDVHVARVSLVELSGVPLLTLEPVAQEQAKVFVKRLLDLAMGIVVLFFAWPLLALIAIAIQLDSRGPVFFVQERIGQNKRRFRMYKFRTMMEGADRMQEQLEHLNEAQGPIFKISNDPRVTRVGRFLRKTSLDEVPQIFNIVRGEMSFVGPRPMSLRDVDLFDRGIQRKRFSVKPGLTCIWQVSGRSQLPFSKWLELDLYYIENWSLGLDFKILLKTIPAVLKGTGAV
ncbi:MAG: sugar transferase [Acidobacteriia bacterium]|nr:sugar transferase [Terriglobia bacterium]